MNEQEEKLRQEILGDARRKAERLVKRARRDADKALKAVRDEVAELREQRLARTRRRAEERCRAVTAGIDHEIRRQWILRRESLLDEIFEETLPALARGEGIDRAESLRQLLGEALEALGPGRYTVRAADGDAGLLAGELIRAAARHALGEGGEETVTVDVVADPKVRGGLVVDETDGRRQFDNTYATRLKRLKQELRAALCREAAADDASEEQHG